MKISGSILAGLTALAVLTGGASAHAQTVADENASEPRTTTWYAMIALRGETSRLGCDGWTYKVSTSEPIIFRGPQVVSEYHSQEVVAAWLQYLSERSPRFYRLVMGRKRSYTPYVYFRENREEVVEAFGRAGHLTRSAHCEGLVLLTHGTSSFTFDPPPGFARSDFGTVPSMAQRDAVIVRDIAKIPGIN